LVADLFDAVPELTAALS